jgi:hypothetical protein
MSKPYRRFEVLLPLRFNQGEPVPEALIADTLLELEDRFGSVSADTSPIRGHWHYQGQLFRDELMRVFVDVPDLPEHVQFFQEFKERLKQRFQQIDIWMTTYVLEVLWDVRTRRWRGESPQPTRLMLSRRPVPDARASSESADGTSLLQYSCSESRILSGNIKFQFGIDRSGFRGVVAFLWGAKS